MALCELTAVELDAVCGGKKYKGYDVDVTIVKIKQNQHNKTTVVLAAGVGVAAGLVVVAMQWVSGAMHHLLFRLEPGQHLSALVEVNPVHALVVPAFGGLALGLAGVALARWWPRRGPQWPRSAAQAGSPETPTAHP